MKRWIVGACVLGCLTLGAFAYLTAGYGKVLSASTTETRLTGFTARSVSVYNAGSTEIVYAAVNCTTNEFVPTNSVPIPAGASYTFNADGSTSIDSLCYATTNGTESIYVATY